MAQGVTQDDKPLPGLPPIGGRDRNAQLWVGFWLSRLQPDDHLGWRIWIEQFLRHLVSHVRRTSCPTKEMITLRSFVVSVESINSSFLARQSVPERCSRENGK